MKRRGEAIGRDSGTHNNQIAPSIEKVFSVVTAIGNEFYLAQLRPNSPVALILLGGDIGKPPEWVAPAQYPSD